MTPGTPDQLLATVIWVAFDQFCVNGRACAVLLAAAGMALMMPNTNTAAIAAALRRCGRTIRINLGMMRWFREPSEGTVVSSDARSDHLRPMHRDTKGYACRHHGLCVETPRGRAIR